MLLNSNKYLKYFLQRTIPVLVLVLTFSMTGFSQSAPLPKDSFLARGLNSAFIAANKKPFQVRVFYNIPPYKVYTVRKGNELMYWPLFPLSAAQIAARDKRYNQPLGKQIADDIIEAAVNNMIYGSKKPVAVRPRF